MRRVIAALSTAIALVVSVVHAADVAGGKDHPLLSRYQGSQLDGYKQQDFAVGTFYLAKTDAPKKELEMDTPITVEGQLTKLLYLAPKGKSPLEVHRNYELALKNAGAEIKTSVDGKDAWWEPAKHWRKHYGDMTFQGMWASDVGPFWRDGFYTYAVLKKAGSDWHISVLTAQNFQQSETQAAVAIQIVEPKAMETGKVVVNSAAMKSGIEAEGKIALYGIYFDTGKADLKPESNAQLEQMAKLLKEQPSLNVFIVGYTDNQGKFELNQSLSQRRAEAVVNTLVKQHQIAASRLQAKGAANIAPVASNSNEAGRAKNRRVEMVAQ